MKGFVEAADGELRVLDVVVRTGTAGGRLVPRPTELRRRLAV